MIRFYIAIKNHRKYYKLKKTEQLTVWIPKVIKTKLMSTHSAVWRKYFVTRFELGIEGRSILSFDN